MNYNFDIPWLMEQYPTDKRSRSDVFLHWTVKLLKIRYVFFEWWIDIELLSKAFWLVHVEWNLSAIINSAWLWKFIWEYLIEVHRGNFWGGRALVFWCMFLCMNTVVQRIVITRLVCNFINNSRSLLIVDDLAWNNLGFYVYFGATKNS